jgi:P4 family phage/plasmid primase-like protien
MSDSPFVRAADLYQEAGWWGTLPLGRGKKWPPPSGWTGYGAPYPTARDVKQWVGEDIGFGLGQNIALRMNGDPKGWDVVALDVDAYKGGHETMLTLMEKLGPLPLTYSSSARFDVDPHGGHYFFRTPHVVSYLGEAGSGVDILNHHHRYAVVWPSTNPDYEGQVYRWRDPIGRVMPEGEVPNVHDLAELPDPWRAYLTSARERVIAATLTLAETDHWLGSCRTPSNDYPVCGVIRRGVEKAIQLLTDPKAGSRHATARDWTRAIAGYGGEGHVGAAEGLEDLRAAFIRILSTAGQGGSRVTDPEDAKAEFDSMAYGAIRIAAGQAADPSRNQCECPSYVGLTDFRPTPGAPEVGSAAKVDPDTVRDLAPAMTLVGPEGTKGPADPIDPIEGSLPVEDMPPLDGVKRTPEKYDQTSDDMARCYVDWFADDVRYVAIVEGVGSWLVRQGSTWHTDITGRHRELARRLYRLLPSTDVWRRWRKTMLSSDGIGGMLNLARYDDKIVTRLTALDRDAWALNTPGGVVDLRTGEMRPARASEMHTRVTACTPKADPAKLAPWLAYLDRVFAGDTELIEYVQRVLGMSIVGHSHEAVLPFLFGTGRNGKNVLVEVLAFIMSIDSVTGYAHMAGSNFLMQRHHEPHPTDLASLQGRRVVICSEVKKGARFDEERVKALTGNAIVTARKMRTDEFSFPAVHTMFLLGNNYPQVDEGGPSFWERVRIIPFNVFIPPAERVKGLSERLAAENGPAILAWVIEGAVRYAAEGLDPTPECVKAATEEYAEDQNHLGRFVEDRLVVGGGDKTRVTQADMYDEYEQWCKQNRVKPEMMHKSNWLGRVLKAEHGIMSKKSNSKTVYINVSLSVGRGEVSNVDTEYARYEQTALDDE